MPRLALVAAALALGASRFLTDEEITSFYGAPKPIKRYDASVGKMFAANMTLRQAAKLRGVFMGAAMNYHGLTNASDPEYSAVAAAEYDLATAENECKFAETEPGNGVYSLTQCDYVSNFMINEAQGVFRGHNWAWGVNNPSWLVNGSFNATQLQGILNDHITTLATHYEGQFLCWDAVNEAVSDSSDPTVIFKNVSPWYPAVSNYVDLAFMYGRAADPKVKLFYNDYGAEDLNTKSQKIYNLVQSMKQRGIPIDGVGLQMHISVDGYPSPTEVAANIARLGALGLEVHITEMDVRCTPPCGQDRLDLQGDIYAGMLEACLNNTGICTNFETWGFTDRYTWLYNYNNPTHVNMQPLPFDTNYGYKPAYYKMMSVLMQTAE